MRFAFWRPDRFLLHGLAAGTILLFPFLAASPLVARGTPDSFADLASQLLPTVVNIATTQTLKPNSAAQSALPDLPPDSPLQDMFKDFLSQSKIPRHVTSLGSGFVIDPSGLIVTNFHVVEAADDITVTLNDGTSLPAKLIGQDGKTDLALLRIKPKAPLPAAHFGDSDKARIGDWVIAIGNPYGLGSTVTAGIVSARDRDIAAGPYDNFIQTDAPINRGNSGGPLFDMSGNVVGINSTIISPSGGSVGIGFAIPANMAREVVDQLRQYGQTRRGWLGVRVQQVTSDLAEGMGLPAAEGALVADVTPNGPAAKAGIRNGDLVTGFDGKAVPDSRALPRVVADTAIGRTVEIDVLRKGKKETFRVTVAKLDDGDAEGVPKSVKISAAMPTSKLSQLGLSLTTLDGDARTKYHLAGEVQGVVVSAVDPDSAAGEKNLQPGDVIVEVQNQPVHTPQEVAKRMEADAKSGRKVELLLVNRNGDLAYIAIRLEVG
ncbi:MAG TPA: DegQ family serine endoprotease [Rhizomicrobium sp.]